MSLKPPTQGGIYPIYGLFMGGSEVNDNYTLNTSTPYKFMTQIRNPKQSSLPKQMLMNCCSNIGTVTFKGNLEVSNDCITKYDKETFLIALKEQVGF